VIESLGIWREGLIDLETSFGRWLRARRRALNLTQDDLARQVGCAISTA
jgi:hypothetical protein